MTCICLHIHIWRGTIILVYLLIYNCFTLRCACSNYMNGLTQWKDVSQLWFWSSCSLVWVQTDQCEGGFAAVRALHLIPGCITQPVQSNSTQTQGLPLPSKDIEEYCIASCATEVISLLQPNVQSLTWILSYVSKPQCLIVQYIHARTSLS